MEFVPYPSTPDFFKFKKDLMRRGGPQSPNDSDPDDAELVVAPGKPTKGTFIGTVKLHGTNASICCRKSSTGGLTFQYQSRNRVISTRPDDDNAGTAAFFSTLPMETFIDKILRIRKAGDFEEIFIAGEWTGAGIQTGVAVTYLERFFAIFNIRIDGHWVDIRDYKTVNSPEHRVYNIANFKTYEVDVDLKDDMDCKTAYEAMKHYTMEVSMNCPVGSELLQVEGAKVILKKGGTQVYGGEGIVWTMVPTAGYDTQLLNFKTKGEQFLTVNVKAPRRTTHVDSDKVASFVDYALGEHASIGMGCIFKYHTGERRLEQGIEYLKEMGKEPSEMKSLGEFMKWVTGDVLKEEGWKLSEKGEDGQTLLDHGVTEAAVKKLVGARARRWFMDRRNDTTSTV